MGDPYVKLLSTTNISSATLEFQKVRGGNSTLKITNPGDTGTSTQSPGSSPTVITLADLQKKINHLQSLEPIFFAILGVNVLVMATAVGLGVWYFCCRRRKASSGGGGRKPAGRFGRRGRGGVANGNTVSTMELTTKDDSGASYAAVSTLGYDGEPSTPSALRSTYDAVPGARQSTVSFGTDPFRHSRTLSGVSAFRPMVPMPAGAAITTMGLEPTTPIDERGFDAAELMVPSPTTPERARVSSLPASSDAYRRQSSMPPPGAMMAPGATERYRHSSLVTSTNAPIPESEPSTPTRASPTIPRQLSPLSSPNAEQSFNPDDPLSPTTPGAPVSPPSSGGSGEGGNTLTPQRSFDREPPSQRHSAVPGLPFPTSNLSSSPSPTSQLRHSGIPAGARGAPNANGFPPLTRQISPLAGLPAQAFSDPENDYHGTNTTYNTEPSMMNSVEPSMVTVKSSIPQINVSSDELIAPAPGSAPIQGSFPRFSSNSTDHRHSARPPPRAPFMNKDSDEYRRSAAM